MNKVAFIVFGIYFVIVTFVFLLVAQKSQVEATQNHHHGPYPTVSPTHTPSPTPTVEPCHIMEVEEKGDWNEAPCPTPSIEVTPEPTPLVNAGSDGRHSEAPPMPQTGAVVCNGELPKEAYQLNGTTTDTGFHLTWHIGTDGTKQTLFYGPTKERAMEFGYPEDLGSQETSKDINVKGWSHIFFVVKTWKGDCTQDSLVGDP